MKYLKPSHFLPFYLFCVFHVSGLLWSHISWKIGYAWMKSLHIFSSVVEVCLVCLEAIEMDGKTSLNSIEMSCNPFFLVCNFLWSISTCFHQWKTPCNPIKIPFNQWGTIRLLPAEMYVDSEGLQSYKSYQREVRLCLWSSSTLHTISTFWLRLCIYVIFRNSCSSQVVVEKALWL